MTDQHFLELVRAAIAAKSILKKSLARRCKVSRPYFSEMIHGDRPMPDAVRERLINELGLQPMLEKLNDRACTAETEFKKLEAK
jgi:hypothetical protein